MFRRTNALGLLLIGGLWVSPACTIKGPPEPAAPAENGGSGSVEQGGAPPAGGKTSSGGKGGKGGTGGKTASGGKGGSGSEDGGESGAGGDGPACPGCESGFCLEDGTCVDCVPENDRCPQGQYCTAENECAPGCKADGSSCASGSCGDDHNCNHCIADEECIPDLVCGGGVCAAACTEAQEGTSAGCSGGLTCCSLHCTERAVDSQNCGACGTACSSAQFCGLSECQDVAVANVCSVSKVIVILDTRKNDADGNRVTGRAIGSALETQCASTPALTEAEQDSVAALNFTTGQPVSDGGELLVVAGGPYYQAVEGYLETQKIAPLYWKVLPDATEYRKTSNDETVLSLPIEGDHDSRDLFIIQFMRDPNSGSLILNAQGLWLSGTKAAAFQVENAILPNLAAADKAWYAYEWQDADGDQAPDLGEITEISSGN
ncbi:MAG: hypothetical protein EOO73_01815 [Myxococcales bacterium]|nr:MAG: hypothetical protein EOO73_01815 [Myxococcales bacterium]